MGENPAKAADQERVGAILDTGPGQNFGPTSRLPHVSYDVIKRSELPPSTAEGLRVARGWFNEHLPGPDVFEDRAIWFFKTEAKTCMAAAWELIHWLEEAGVVVEMQTVVGRPGRVCYEDKYQVAIVPHADSRVR